MHQTEFMKTPVKTPVKSPRITARHLSLLGGSLLLLVTGLGCEPLEQSDSGPAPGTKTPPPAVASNWHTLDDALVVQVEGDEFYEELELAMAEARKSADEQQKKWLSSPPSRKTRWAIKWAATTTDGRIEYIWVHPVSWTQFRIEGTLANTPINELACVKTLGESVGFPIEELADWIHYTSASFDGPYEGGFTIKVLQERYGEPGE